MTPEEWLRKLVSMTPVGDAAVVLGVIQAAVAEERERCAKIAEAVMDQWTPSSEAHEGAQDIRDRIREG